MKKWLQNFLENEPPYKAVDITAEQLQKLFSTKDITITQYCEICNQQRSFKCFTTGFELMEKDYANFTMASGFRHSIEEFGKRYLRTFLLKFSCQHDCGKAHFIPILICNLSIQKIGQYPTFAKEEVNKKLIKYKSLIPKYYPELTKAVSAYSQNMGVPSFVYLRRVLEHLVDRKANKYSIDTEQKFIDKLKEVEDHEKIIPVEFDEIKNQLYTILSKGVHEYEENECIEMFSAVKFIIESILDAELIKKEHEYKAKEAKAIIQKKLKND